MSEINRKLENQHCMFPGSGREPGKTLLSYEMFHRYETEHTIIHIASSELRLQPLNKVQLPSQYGIAMFRFSFCFLFSSSFLEKYKKRENTTMVLTVTARVTKKMCSLRIQWQQEFLIT
ncbi:hypothetical protein XENORESO_011727 [Xenotaenia resolanae]|uniref:Uncharacterized protein n=1 Tax=Xenotaenia resolanae TaxID=208358 RepID=A0ABV0WZS1_9TELE